ncbi:MAG: DNA photolyase, partial [Desulfobacterales bacterium]
MISKLYIDEAISQHPTVSTVRQSLPDVPISIVPDTVKVHEALAATRDPIAAGKRVLYLTRNKGSFLRKCPGTKSYICCGYQILHIGTYCTMDCAYCILQAYFHPPFLQYFVNQERLFQELHTVFQSERPPFHR